MAGGYHLPLSGRLECEQHNLGVRSHAQGRAPGAGAPVRKNEHSAEAMEAMDIGAIHAGRDPGAWRELSSMSMAAKLKRNSRFLGDGQPMRRMHEQDAWPLGCDGGAVQDCSKLPGIDGLAVVHSDEL